MLWEILSWRTQVLVNSFVAVALFWFSQHFEDTFFLFTSVFPHYFEVNYLSNFCVIFVIFPLWSPHDIFSVFSVLQFHYNYYSWVCGLIFLQNSEAFLQTTKYNLVESLFFALHEYCIHSLQLNFYYFSMHYKQIFKVIYHISFNFVFKCCSKFNILLVYDVNFIFNLTFLIFFHLFLEFRVF